MANSNDSVPEGGHALQSNRFFYRNVLRGLKTGGLGAFAASSMALGGAVHAQQQAADQPVLDEIQVTGSRITRSGMTTPTPVTTMTNVELRAMAPGNLIDAMDQLPQFLGNETPGTAFNFAGAAGASNLNMRGIGPNRTLVLLNGRRVVSSSRLGSTDLNLFPEAMIQNVEVVTGGASAAYGSDAVAGVTNFILDTGFTGVEAHVQGGITSRGDNENWEGSVSFGTPIGERMHMIASIDYHKANRVEGYDKRNWFNSWGTVTNPDWLAAGCQIDVPCAAGPQLLTRPNVTSTQYTFGGLINQPDSALHRLMFLSDGSATPFVLGDPGVVGTGTQSHSGGSGDNLQADRGGEGGVYPDVNRSTAFLYLEGDVSDNLSWYVQGIRGNNRTNFNGFTTLQFGPWQSRIYSGNAYLPAELQDIMDDEGLESFGFSRLASTADLGQARVEQENTTNSFTTGFNAEVANWRVNGYYQYGRNENRIRFFDFTRIDRLSLALDAVVDPQTGAIVCNAALTGFAPDCVPINLFGEGNVSRQAREYVLGSGKVTKARLQQHFTEITADGEVHDGWGAGAISLAVGASFRDDSIRQNVIDDSGPTPVNDPANGVRGVPAPFAGSAEGYQFATTPEMAGNFQVWELFTETLVPLWSGAGGQQLDLSLAARWADYSGSGSVWAYKAGLDWQATSELRLRGTYSRDVRAANLSERFDAQGQGASANDPEFGGDNFEFGQTIGGNPEVDPEEADTFTIGFVYQPNWFDGFSLSADWYSISIDGAIAQLGVQRIVDDCFAGAEALCDQITRDPDTNIITNVQNVFLNVAEAKVMGADLEGRYTTAVNWFGDNSEQLTVRLLTSWLGENSITNLGVPKQDNVGMTGFGSFPKWQSNLSATYMNGPFSLFVQQRYIGSGTRDAQHTSGVQIDNNRVASVMYTDMRLGYNFDLPGSGELEAYGHVTNLFDRSPPLAADHFPFFGSTHTNENLFDVLGRRFVAGVRVRY